MRRSALSRTVSVLGLMLLLTLVTATAWGEEAAQPAATAPSGPPLAELLAGARQEWLAQAYMYVHKTYPDLAQPVVELINSKYPQFWEFATVRLDELAAAKDPTLYLLIRAEALAILERVAPQLYREVIDLINRRYPLLLVERAEIIRTTPPEADPQAEIAKLLRERYPTLLADVRDEVLVKHPRVLSQIANAIAEKWPGLFGEVVKRVNKQFPKLAGDVFDLAAQKHPELTEAMGKILSGEPMPVETAATPPASGAATDAPKPETGPPPK